MYVLWAGLKTSMTDQMRVKKVMDHGLETPAAAGHDEKRITD